MTDSSTGGGTTILKLGGSVVTDKAEPETIDETSLGRAADAVATHLGTGAAAASEVPALDGGGLLLVHGGGSFGHYHASDHGVSTVVGTRDAAATLAIHDAMKALNGRVLARLHERGVPALPIHPLSAAARDEESGLELATTAAERLLAEGFVPVLHGDVVAHEGMGTTIVSGDELVTTLTDGLDADRVGLCSTVPGVLDHEGAVVDRIESLDGASEYLGESEETDVTGGMHGKVKQLLALAVPASVFGLDELDDFLAGDSPGTRVG